MRSKSSRALAVEATLFDPNVVSVAGLATTPAGSRYADTFANDARHETPWHPVQHERVLLTMFATARSAVTPAGLFNVPTGDRARVFLFNLSEEKPGCITDQDGSFDLLFEDGRQRRRLVAVAEQRLAWIRRTFVAPLWDEEKDPEARRIALRNRLLDYGATKMREGADANTLPPVAEGDVAPAVGQLVAPWLDEAMVDALVAPPDEPDLAREDGVGFRVLVTSSRWFDDDGDVVPMGLRLEVVDEDPDVKNDYRILLDNMRRKESSVDTTYAVRGEQVRRMLAAKDAEGKPRFTPHSLAVELKVSKDWVNNALHYGEIADVVRAAVDAGRISLKLAATGREAICYGFDKQGKRSLLSAAEQAAILDKLVHHFGVEVAAEDGIQDNSVTRAVLKKIKGEILAGTPFAEGLDKSRETASVTNARVAAARAGVTTSSPGEIDADMKKSLAQAAADADREEGEDDEDAGAGASGTSDSGTAKKAPSKAKEPPSHDPPARDPRKLREQLLARAKSQGIDAGAVDLRKKTTPDLDAVALAAGLAVLDALGGDSSALLRFPILSGKVAKPASTSAPKAASKSKPKAAEGSPFAAEDQARGVLATLVDLWAEKKDPDFDPRKLVNDAAEQELGSKATAEAITAAAKMLDDALEAYKTKPSHPKLEIHLREWIAG